MEARSINTSISDQLEKEVGHRVKRLGGSLESLDYLTTESVFELPNSGLSRQLLAEDAPEDRPKLPEVKFAFSTHPLSYTILITLLKINEDGSPQTEPSLWWLALARAKISPNLRSDLYIFYLVESSDRAPKLSQSWLERIERDDKFCRKMVFQYVPGKDMTEEINSFLDRTFLSLPWESTQKTKAGALDPLENIVKEFAEKANIDINSAKAFIEILSGDSIDTKSRADALIQKLEGPNAK